MSALPAVVPVSDLRRDAAELLNEVSRTREPVIITQRGYPRAVLQDFDEYQFLLRKLEIAELLAQGERDIQAGNTIPADQAIARMYEQVEKLEA